MITVAPTQSDALIALRAYILSVLPAGIEVVRGQDNRVPEPVGADFVVMTPLRRRRLSTNVDSYGDVKFVGSINGTTMTVSSVAHGAIQVGSRVFGVSVTDATVVTALGTGTGGVGTYSVSPSQTVSSETLSAGTESLLGPVEHTIQLDVHGPNSAENAQIISTTLRDDYATRAFSALSGSVYPLHADEPRQMPFVNAEAQYEFRWVLEVCLQTNEAVSVPQQFADTAIIGLVDVDAVYPP